MYNKMKTNTLGRLLALVVFPAAIFFIACNPAKRSTSPVANKPGKPNAPGKYEPIDTVRWTPNNGKPPIKNDPSRPGDRPAGNGETYHIGFLLPFLTNQASGSTVPEKSRLALQFYAGAKIALEQVSTEANINLVVDAWDTQANDADFQSLLQTATRIQKPSVYIGPIRSAHVESFATWAKSKRKIVVSPETPNAELTRQNPDFIQTNPSLKAHCAAIAQYVRQSHRADAITLVCKQKESDRLPYFQQGNTATSRFAEVLVPDDAVNFDKIDLKKYIKAGKTAVFILPSWASQDFVMAFLRKLKEVKGSNRVEVYGMPQWRNFEVIDVEYLIALNVHITTASYIDYSAPAVKAFQQKFYEATGTIPDEDGFNGYDVTLFTARMLAKHGLSFPEHLERSPFTGLHGTFGFSKIYLNGLDAAAAQPDYLENTRVQMLKFGKYGYEPAGK
jgi:ABC-type branched-subunit amino acid transport system substrate-binding protein